MSREDIELLLEACGVRSPLTLDLEQPADNLVKTVSLDFPFATIGRIQANDVVLDDEQVGRRHAYLQVIAGRVFCVDFRTRTGTHWEGGSGNTWLEEGQWLKIGTFTIRLHPLERNKDVPWPDLSKTDPLRSLRAGADPLGKFTLQFIKGVKEKSDWQMQRVLALVGGSPQCKVQLVDPRVSRYHCSLLRTPLGTWVIDLFGRGGVRVNGVHVRFAQLHDGDELQVGGVKTRAEYDSACDVVVKPDSLPAAIAADSTSVSTPNAAVADLAPAAGAVQTIGTIVPAVPAGADWIARPLMELDRLSVMASPRTELKVSDQENLVNTLLYHFGQVQQQMAEQFHQALMTMVQMFSTFHREQMGLVRAEMDRLHELNQEIVAIQKELSRWHPPRHSENKASGSTVMLPRVEAKAGKHELARGSGGLDEAATLSDRGADRTTAAKSSKPAAPTTDNLPKPRAKEHRRDKVSGNTARGDNAGAVPHGVAGHVSPQGIVAPVEGSAPQGAKPAGTPALPPSASPSEDVHIMLCRRMESIRAEQETLWQKILQRSDLQFPEIPKLLNYPPLRSRRLCVN